MASIAGVSCSFADVFTVALEETCVFLVEDELNWYEGQHYCAGIKPSAHLAVIDTSIKNDMLPSTLYVHYIMNVSAIQTTIIH